MDLIDTAVAIAVVAAVGGLAIAVLCPMDAGLDDVMQQVHGDQPRRPQ